MRLTLQFAQHRPTLVDGWLGNPDWRLGPRVPVATLRASLDELLLKAEREALASDETDAPRVAYLRGQLRALSHVASRLSGESTRFADEVQLAFGVPLPEIDREQAAVARTGLDAELRGEGRLRERYLDFTRHFEVPETRFDQTLAAAIRVCRARAAPLLLPRTERVEIAFEPSSEWPAFARYAGRHTTIVTFGSKAGHNVASLLHTTCHETVPGHHAQHVLIDDALVTGRRWLEFQLAPAFGPHLLIAEGAAEAAVALALPDDEYAQVLGEFMDAAGFDRSDAPRLARVSRLAEALEPLVPGIIAQYLDNDRSREATIAALADEALIPDPERFLAFAERHRTNAVVYSLGKAVVSASLARHAANDRWTALTDLFTVKPFLTD